jgi:hypothetical protein
MSNYTDYEVYCAGAWVAGSTDLDEAMGYAQQYREEGRVEVFEVKKTMTLVAKMSAIRKAQEQ